MALKIRGIVRELPSDKKLFLQTLFQNYDVMDDQQ